MTDTLPSWKGQCRARARIILRRVAGRTCELGGEFRVIKVICEQDEALMYERFLNPLRVSIREALPCYDE